MIVRPEGAADFAAIDAVHRAAFGRGAEADLVNALRATGDLISALSFVALAGDQVIGHVAGSNASIEAVPAVGLGPIGVRPDQQDRGAGTALMTAVIAAADELGSSSIGLLGDPAYYRRFGWRPASDFGVSAPDPAWGEHFQLLPLTAWNPSTRGVFRYAPAFDEL